MRVEVCALQGILLSVALLTTGVRPISFSGSATVTSTSCTFAYELAVTETLCCRGLYEVTGRVTGGGYRYSAGNTSSDFDLRSLCARRSKAFIWISSLRSKLVVDLSRYHNLSSGHTTFSGSGGFRPIRGVSEYKLRLYIGEPGSIECGGSKGLVSHDFSVVYTSVQPLPECTSSSQAAAGGSWAAASDHDDMSSDASYGDWLWTPINCSRSTRNQSDALAYFLETAMARNLTDIVLVGTSRVRTLYYDLIDMLDPSIFKNILAHKKSHHHMNHSLPSHGGLRVWYHHFECGAKKYHNFGGYNDAWSNIVLDFKTNGICQFNNHSGSQAVVFSTGICESVTGDTKSFAENYPPILRRLRNLCNSSRTAFIVKSEESVDPNIANVDFLDQNRRSVYSALRGSNQSVALLDAYPISRSWKVCNDSLDGTHLYSHRGQYTGNIASKAIVLLLLAGVAEQLRGDAPAPLPASPPPSPLDLEDGLNGRAIANDKDKHTRGRIYFVWSGKKRLIPDWDTLVALKLDAREIVYLPEEAFQAIPSGGGMSSVNA